MKAHSMKPRRAFVVMITGWTVWFFVLCGIATLLGGSRNRAAVAVAVGAFYLGAIGCFAWFVRNWLIWRRPMAEERRRLAAEGERLANQDAWNTWNAIKGKVPKGFPTDRGGAEMAGFVKRVHERHRTGYMVWMDFGDPFGLQDTWWANSSRQPNVGKWVVFTGFTVSEGNKYSRPVIHVIGVQEVHDGLTRARAERHLASLRTERELAVAEPRADAA
jgi:hypothetical protein